MADRQPANLLGALALAVVDRAQDAIGATTGQTDNAAVALSALDQLLSDPSIDTLGRMLGLSSSGTVRLVDRLVAAGLVKRAVGADGRVTTVALTAAGRRASRRVSTARITVLERALSVLDEDERAQFGTLAGRLLVGLIRTKTIGIRWTCRMCETGACRRSEGRCPVAIAARSLFEPSAAREP